MHTLLLSDSHVAAADGSGSLLSQQKQTDFKMNTKREKNCDGCRKLALKSESAFFS
jgi:hypothetical protein